MSITFMLFFIIKISLNNVMVDANAPKGGPSIQRIIGDRFFLGKKFHKVKSASNPRCVAVKLIIIKIKPP